MFDDGDDFSRGVRIGDLAFVREPSKFPEGEDELLEDLLGQLASVVAQELHFRGDVGIVDGVGREQIPQRSEKVVAQKGKTGSIGQNLGEGLSERLSESD